MESAQVPPATPRHHTSPGSRNRNPSPLPRFPVSPSPSPAPAASLASTPGPPPPRASPLRRHRYRPVYRHRPVHRHHRLHRGWRPLHRRHRPVHRRCRPLHHRCLIIDNRFRRHGIETVPYRLITASISGPQPDLTIFVFSLFEFFKPQISNSSSSYRHWIPAEKSINYQRFQNLITGVWRGGNARVAISIMHANRMQMSPHCGWCMHH